MATIAEQIKALKEKLATTTSPVTQNSINKEIFKLELIESSSKGSQVANSLVILNEILEKVTKNLPKGGGIDKDEAEKMIKNVLSDIKIGKNDLDDELKTYLMQSVKIGLELKTPSGTSKGGTVEAKDYERPLFQKILSDLVAMNNVYLYGGAGTGKTYIARQIADFMEWEYIELNCNQFTSQLDILGGQTIDGYQRGKLEMAWGNIDERGNSTAKKGAVLCLDELPKIDPNTAGILNAALASVKNYKGNIPPFILNGKNEKIFKGNLLIIATGNVKLNEMSTEYEANFKQDLSLQDRFVGSTYEVIADYEYERNQLMQGFLWLWIALIKLREKIVEMRWTGQAFVSMRIMVSLKDTYIAYRQIEDKTINTATNTYLQKLDKPKTLKNGIDSFLNLFKPEQVEQLKTAMNYDEFVQTTLAKDKLPLDKLNTDSEKLEADEIVKKWRTQTSNRIA